MATPIPPNQARFTLAEIARVTGGTLIGADSETTALTTDSRAVQAGDLYLALRGETHDGHAFVAQAFERGAGAALVAEASALPAGRCGVVVEDTLRALGQLAGHHRKRWGGRVIAITGSAGKTTTKELTYAALHAAGARVMRSAGNLNNLIGAPMMLLTLDTRVDLAVIEIGTNAPGEIARLSEICAPDVGVVTAVAVAHTEGLGSLEQVAAEKAALLVALPESGTAIYRADHAALTAQLGKVRAKRRIGFGITDAADVQLKAHALTATPSMRVELRIGHGAAPLQCDLGLFGIGPALDAAAALAVVLAVLGETALAPAARGLLAVPPVPGRLAPLAGPLGALILDDSYNANPASMQTSIETALELGRVRGGRTLFVLGDMRELGANSREEHEAVGRLTAQPGVAALIACGVEMTAAAEAAREQARRVGAELSIAHLSDPGGAAELVHPLLRATDVVLVKGSRSMAMERVTRGLTRGGAA